MGKKITTKKQFLNLWKAGLLGNRLRVWDTVGAALASSYSGELTIRSKTPGSGFFVPVVHKADLEREVVALYDRGARPLDLYFGEIPKHGTHAIQGELTGLAGSKPYYFTYSNAKCNLRDAVLKHSSVMVGLRTLITLQHHMTPNSYDEVMWLLHEYPQHVIELSVFDYNLGIFPNRNTVIWEVRLY